MFYAVSIGSIFFMMALAALFLDDKGAHEEKRGYRHKPYDGHSW